MDIVYVVREGEKNDNLRYSLRSLKNIPHDDVYIIGHKPEWVKNVKYINRMQRVRNKFQNISRNMWLATKTSSISDDFIYMDDDFALLPTATENATAVWSDTDTYAPDSKGGILKFIKTLLLSK